MAVDSAPARGRSALATRSGAAEGDRAAVVAPPATPVLLQDECLALLGHELRNPLGVIATTVNVLRWREGARAAREAEIIDRQVAHLLRLSEDLLLLARASRGTLTLCRAPLDLREVLAQARQAAASWLAAAGHHLEMQVEPGLVADLDADRMSQVFANLLVNAAKYTPAPGEIRVEACRQGRLARISVSDNGVGIAADAQPRIFDMFVTAHQSAGGGAASQGIGLALAKYVVGLHGGAIAVRSDGPGQGSTFTVTVPLARPA